MSSIPSSVLIVRLDAIGDALTTVPLIAALRRYGMRVGAVLRPVNAEVFAPCALERVHVLDGKDIIEEIRRERYDCALIPTEKPRAYQIAHSARIPVRIGFENGWGKPLKTLWIRSMCTETIFRTAGLDPSAPHECEVVFKLARSIVPDAGPPRDPAVLRPLIVDNAPGHDERIAVQVSDKWQRLGARNDDVIELIRRLRARHDLRLVGSQAERAYCDLIAAGANQAVEIFESVRDWESVIANARALVAPDSGAVHVAGMTGTPVIACFAAQDFELQTSRWAPWAAPYDVVKIEGEAWPLVSADALEMLLTDNPRSAYKG